MLAVTGEKLRKGRRKRGEEIREEERRGGREETRREEVMVGYVVQ